MGASDGDRRRAAILLLFAGMMLVVLAAFAYVSWERKRLPPPTTQLTEARKAELRSRIRAPLRVVIAATGLMFLFVILGYAFLAWSRAYRARLMRPPSPPTPVEDLWSLHKLPEEVDEPGRAEDASDDEES